MSPSVTPEFREDAFRSGLHRFRRFLIWGSCLVLPASFGVGIGTFPLHPAIRGQLHQWFSHDTAEGLFGLLVAAPALIPGVVFLCLVQRRGKRTELCCMACHRSLAEPNGEETLMDKGSCVFCAAVLLPERYAQRDKLCQEREEKRKQFEKRAIVQRQQVSWTLAGFAVISIPAVLVLDYLNFDSIAISMCAFANCALLSPAWCYIGLRTRSVREFACGSIGMICGAYWLWRAIFL